MTVPTIHANGTGKASLIEALCAASAALDAAYDALKQTAPNGRDYCPQGPGVLAQAQDEHFARLATVESVKSEVDRLTVAIDESAP